MSCAACKRLAWVTRAVQKLLRDHDSVAEVQSSITLRSTAPRCLPAPSSLLLLHNTYIPVHVMPVRQQCTGYCAACTQSKRQLGHLPHLQVVDPSREIDNVLNSHIEHAGSQARKHNALEDVVARHQMSQDDYQGLHDGPAERGPAAAMYALGQHACAAMQTGAFVQAAGCSQQT